MNMPHKLTPAKGRRDLHTGDVARRGVDFVSAVNVHSCSWYTVCSCEPSFFTNALSWE
jgi:hypothetical protein